MRPLLASVGPLVTASATNIRTASAGVAGALVLNGSLVSGGVATTDKSRRLVITTSVDETGKTLVLTGTNWQGNIIGETVTMSGAGPFTTVLSYKTLTSAVLSANSAGNISIGTSAVADSNWVALDGFAEAPVSIVAVVSGTVNFDVEVSMDDPNRFGATVVPGTMGWAQDPNITGKTASLSAQLQVLPTWARVKLNSGNGSVTAYFNQPGIVSQ